MSDIKTTRQNLLTQIEKICVQTGRNPRDVQLMAVSKMQPPEKIQEALDTGQRLFGENKVQEAQTHWGARRAEYPDLSLHLIGPLQTNKADDAVVLFDVIETLDRPKLVDALVTAMKKHGKIPECYIQVNTGNEEQKAGVSIDDLPALLDYARAQGLMVTGLMCIPPMDAPPALHFALLYKLAQRHALPNLSMGMSADFEKAIPLGATIIRVGTAFFGARP